MPSELHRLHPLELTGMLLFFAPAQLWLLTCLIVFQISPLTSAANETVLSTPLNGTIHVQRDWIIDPAVYADEFVKNFPSSSDAAVQNARLIATIIKKLFQTSGFEVRHKGEHVGFWPVMYMGFPKHGTTSAMEFLHNNVPCLVQRGKEPHFWGQTLQAKCQKEGNLLVSCNEDDIVQQVLRYLRGADIQHPTFVSDEKRLLESGQCEHPIFIDGSVTTLTKSSLTVVSARHVTQVPFHPTVVIRELAPSTRFLVLHRDWNTALLRSSWWYFHQTAKMEKYFVYLRSQRAQLVKVAAAPSSRCRTYLKTLADIQWWADSCKLAALEELFGSERVFLTEVHPLVHCQTNFTAWWSKFILEDLHIPQARLHHYRSECLQPASKRVNVMDSAHADAEIEKAKEKIEKEEQAVLEIANRNLLPLLRATKEEDRAMQEEDRPDNIGFDWAWFQPAWRSETEQTNVLFLGDLKLNKPTWMHCASSSVSENAPKLQWKADSCRHFYSRKNKGCPPQPAGVRKEAIDAAGWLTSQTCVLEDLHQPGGRQQAVSCSAAAEPHQAGNASRHCPAAGFPASEFIVNHEYKVLYVENRNPESLRMVHIMKKAFGSDFVSSCPSWSPECKTGPKGRCFTKCLQMDQTERNFSEYFLFAFAGDPVDRFFFAFQHSFQHIFASKQDCPTVRQRMMQVLDDLEQKQGVADPHLATQAFALSSTVHTASGDAMLDLDWVENYANLEASLPQLLERIEANAGKAIPAKKKARALAVPRQRHFRQTRKVEMCATKGLVQRIRTVYAQDAACFGNATL